MRRMFFVVAPALLLFPWTLVRGEDLPSEAQKLVEELEKEKASIQKDADTRIKASTARYITILQSLQEKYAKAGLSDEADAIGDKIEELKNGKTLAKADPGNLTGLATEVGKSFRFEVTGQATGSVWGTDLYTTDSTLATAAVHAGVLANGQKGVVEVIILPGEPSYTGSTRNGVTTSSWGAYGSSFRVGPAGRKRTATPKVGASGARPNPGTLTAFAGQSGKSFLFEVTGQTTGFVWGSGPYTTDSDLATAAVHAGLLTDGQKGVIKVTILPGEASYAGSARNGVTTSSWDSFGSSFRVEAVKK